MTLMLSIDFALSLGSVNKLSTQLSLELTLIAAALISTSYLSTPGEKSPPTCVVVER